LSFSAVFVDESNREVILVFSKQPVEADRKYLTEEELRRFMGVIKSPRDRAIFAVCYWRGLRASEIGMLPLSAYRPQAKTLFVTRLKGSMSGEFPVSPLEVRTLNTWLKVRGAEPGPLFISRNGRGVCRNRIFMLMRKYGKKAGLPLRLCHPHSLKHSIATHLIGRHSEIFAVKDWLGHKSINSTLEYAQFRNAQRTAEAQRIYEGE
jgi:type 1 fimbriae regulatory protein FimB